MGGAHRAGDASPKGVPCLAQVKPLENQPDSLTPGRFPARMLKTGHHGGSPVLKGQGGAQGVVCMEDGGSQGSRLGLGPPARGPLLLCPVITPWSLPSRRSAAVGGRASPALQPPHPFSSHGHPLCTPLPCTPLPPATTCFSFSPICSPPGLTFFTYHTQPRPLCSVPQSGPGSHPSYLTLSLPNVCLLLSERLG